MDNYWKSLWNTVTARIRKVLKMENSVGEMVKRDFDFFEEEKRVREEWWWGVIIMHVKWRRGRWITWRWEWRGRSEGVVMTTTQKQNWDSEKAKSGEGYSQSKRRMGMDRERHVFFFCSPLTMERHVAILEWRIIILSTIRSRSSHLLQFSSKFWA